MLAVVELGLCGLMCNGISRLVLYRLVSILEYLFLWLGLRASATQGSKFCCFFSYTFWLSHRKMEHLNPKI